MKIIHLLDSVNRGGAETLALDVLKNASANELDLTLVIAGGGALARDFASAGAVFLKTPRKLPIDPFVVRELRRIVKQTNADIIHAHQAVEGIHALCAALGTKTKIVSSHHGFVADAKNRLALKFLIPRVARNVVVSCALADWYLRDAGINVNHNLSVIYNGVDARRLAADASDLRRELKIDEKTKIFGMISNFYAAPRKDQATLARALPRIFARYPDARCVFVGKTEAGAQAKFAECVEICRAHDLSEKVHFLGLREDVPQILRALDVFVLSSLHEGLPIAVLEAMLATVPCVLSDIEPLLEVSENGKSAEIFPAQNAAALAEAIIKLLENDEHRTNLAARAKAHAETNFSIEAHLANLKKLYAELL